MKKLGFIGCFLLSLSTLSFANPLQQSVTHAVQTAQVQQLFGTVEAVWQFTRRNEHNKHPLTPYDYTRTHTPGVLSGDFVFFRYTANFKPSPFGKEPKLVELIFTSDEGQTFRLNTTPVPLRKRWVYTPLLQQP